ncbi:hypothetical protein R8G64_13150 [Tenacibaculum maritimum]|uniref:hypothetical protein n=1 Tax=Tenacibaculum maritimum TaxID=107401 RepID=UPI0012E5B5C8|nr:hypothetical protein [Tenacibaculum maritimum]CAA0260485.1 conserved hypothetical protein [Tenacibaculum maritimum]
MSTKTNRPTKEEIAAWKKEHGAIYQITVEDKIIILREPKIKDLERAMSADPKNKKKFNFNRSIIENCSLYSDPGAMDSDKKTLAVFAELDELIPEAEASTKKL